MELKNISTQELIRELKSRGFVTDLLIGIEDVKRNIEEINGEINDDESKIVMTDEEMVGVLKSMSNDIENHALVPHVVACCNPNTTKEMALQFGLCRIR